LLVCADILLFGEGEAIIAVVVTTVNNARPLLASLEVEARKVRGKGVAIEEYQVIGVDLADSGVNAVIPSPESGFEGVAGFVKRIITCNPGVPGQLSQQEVLASQV
jgi:hypothetical protein